MLRNKTARQHNFAIVPRSDNPRSKFRMRQTRKQAFNASELVPIMCEEVLPGDVWQHNERLMARLATPIAPVLDDLDIETFYFFCPCRILTSTSPSIGTNQNSWEAFITGTDDITIPKIIPPEVTATWTIPTNSVLDHFGLPPGVYTVPPAVTALPFFAYFQIYNEWFRDQNLQSPWTWDSNFSIVTHTDEIVTDEDVPVEWDMMCLRANKRSDYFTRSLTSPQKGPAVTLPLGTMAPVLTSATDTVTGVHEPMHVSYADGSGPFDQQNNYLGTGANGGADSNKLAVSNTPAGFVADDLVYPSNLYADLMSATAVSINAIRLASVTQQILERDARGGSRYVEQNVSHWGVRTPDFRLQRPEYLGGSRIPVTSNPIAQTANYETTIGADDSAVGNLGAEMHASGANRTFTYSATEHGYIIGLAVARATPTYQQGFRRHWIARNTRLDYFFPLMSNLGEQAVLTKEIFSGLNFTPAVATWGYQEFAAEYRYTPNEITGVLRSTYPQSLDWWHYAEEFENEPALNAEFITDKTQETLERSLAVNTSTSTQWSAQIIMDIVHDSNVARLMPAYSVPGIERF